MGTDFKARQGWHICRKRAFEKFQAPSGATSSEYAAPTGLKFCLGCSSIKMPRLRRCGMRRHVAALKARTCPRTPKPHSEFRRGNGSRRLGARSLAMTEIRLVALKSHESGCRRICRALPTPLKLVRTDADGKFSLLIPKKGNFYLAVQAQRLISEKTEKYYWFI
jgi:hypothetical protein